MDSEAFATSRQQIRDGRWKPAGRRKCRGYTVQVDADGLTRREAFELGLDLMNATLGPGPRSLAEIAAFCGLTVGGAQMAVKAAIGKLRAAAGRRPGLVEALPTLVERRRSWN